MGWALQIKWKKFLKSWVNLKDWKESNTVDVADYVTACGIEQEPAFAWWVTYTLRKRDIIVSAVYLKVKRCSHKYGIEVPTSIVSAKNID